MPKASRGEADRLVFVSVLVKGTFYIAERG